MSKIDNDWLVVLQNEFKKNIIEIYIKRYYMNMNILRYILRRKIYLMHFM